MNCPFWKLKKMRGNVTGDGFGDCFCVCFGEGGVNTELLNCCLLFSVILSFNDFKLSFLQKFINHANQTAGKKVT
jgi:hypothetical protein